MRPPLNRTYTESSVRREKGGRRNSSPSQSQRSAGSAGASIRESASSTNVSPLTSPPAGSTFNSKMGISSGVSYQDETRRRSQDSSRVSWSAGGPSSSNQSMQGLQPGDVGRQRTSNDDNRRSQYNMLPTQQDTGTAEGIKRPLTAPASSNSSVPNTSQPVRPKAERRQSSSRRLANAMRPLFRRTSSQQQQQQPPSSSSSQQFDQHRSSTNAPQASPLGNASPGVSSATMSASSSSTQKLSRSRPASGVASTSAPPSPAMTGVPGPVAALASSVASTSSHATAAGRRPMTSSSSRSAYSIAASTPSPGADTIHQAPFPSPFFSQMTPTHAHPNPFSAAQLSIDCVLPLTSLLSQPISATLAQLIPFNLMNPFGSPPSSNLGSNLAGASTTSLATSAISEAATTSTTPHTVSTSQHVGSAWQPSSGMVPSQAMFNCAFASNEQLAASSLNLPTTSIGTIWRIARALEWVAETGPRLNAIASSRMNPMTPRADSAQGPSNPASAAALADDVVFDFASMLQSVLDCLAATAAEKNVDLSFFHGSAGQYFSASHRFTRGDATEQMNASSRFEMPDVQEAFVRGDERGLGVGLLVILKQILSQCSCGSTLEIGTSFTLTSSSESAPATGGPLRKTSLSDLSKQPKDSRSRADSNLSIASEEHDDANSVVGTYLCSIEITHTYPAGGPQAASPTSPDAGSLPSMGAKALDPNIMAALLQCLRLTFVTLPEKGGSQVYKITCVLPQGPHPAAMQLAEASARRRKSIDQGREPSIPELVRFVDTALRGKRAALHSPEHSPFAKHLSHHLASWGLDVTHFSTTDDDDTTASWDGHSRPYRHQIPGHLGRFDSGFGGSDGVSSAGMPGLSGLASPALAPVADPMTAYGQASSVSPPSRSVAGSEPASTLTSPPLDPTLNFIIIDDDVPTLKRQLISIRNNAPSVQLHNALLAKRPQLQSRRTRSSQAVQRATQLSVSVIHFTSLTNYRQIKELVHSILKSASPMFPLPEVLVVPKPVGPRRLLTTLFNAVKRPQLDPYFVPIATSPSSPGGHYFFAGGRPSPAPSHVNDFDVAAGQAIAAQQMQAQQPPLFRQAESLSGAMSHISGPKTPSVSGQNGSNPPSPISPDALEYFSKSAAELGSSASQGVIIQSPDGRPAGLFFPPRAASLHERAESLRMSRAPGDSNSSEQSPPSSRTKQSPTITQTSSIVAGTELPAIVIPEHMEITTTTRGLTISPTSMPVDTPQSIGQRAETLAAAKQAELPISSSASMTKADNESISDESLNQEVPQLANRSTPAGASSPPPKSVDRAAAGSSSTPASPNSVAKPSIPPSGASSTAAPAVVTPVSPLKTPGLSSGSAPDTPIPQDAAITPPVPLTRKLERRATGRVKRPPRRPTGTLVPPINVLIVEDNPINQIILSTFLKRKGIKYSVANNGQEAVDAWKTGDFHLVLMDIQLPVKDGIEATQEIRAMERAGSGGFGFVGTPASDGTTNPLSPPPSTVTSPYELPVIIVALTASSLQSDRVNALAAGCNDFLTKPVSLQWLNQKLVEWGSMAYLSGFGSKRRNTLSTAGGSNPSRSTSTGKATSPPEPSEEEKAAAAKAEKEAMKARMMAMMTRRPAGLEKKAPTATASPSTDPASTMAQPSFTRASSAVPGGAARSGPATSIEAPKADVSADAPATSSARAGVAVPEPVENKVQAVLQEPEEPRLQDPEAASAAVEAGLQAMTLEDGREAGDLLRNQE